MAERMISTCPACGRRTPVEGGAAEALCACGRRYDPLARATVVEPFLGREFGGCRVEAPLGSGGTALVYRATHLGSGRAVALKVLPPGVPGAPPPVPPDHPGIVRLLDRGVAEGRAYLVLELVEGGSLRDRLRRGPLPPAEAVAILLPLLEALAFAHGKGILHRDLKPENVLLGEEGSVKIADFAPAPARAAGPHRTVHGTFEYLAPERRAGEDEGDPRSDLFSCGVLLHEMLTGELPIGRFEAASRRVAGVDPAFDAFLDRALAQDPAARFPDARAMAAALAALRPAAGATRPAPAAALPRHRPPTAYDARLDLLLTLLACAGIGATIAGLALLAGRRPLETSFFSVRADPGGALLAIYGAALWSSAERARRFRAGARRALLALAAAGSLFLAALPLVLFALATLLRRDMRVYYATRGYGLDADEAAAVAQGLRPRPRRLRRGRAARLAAAPLFALSLAAIAAGALGLAPRGLLPAGAGGILLAILLRALPGRANPRDGDPT